VLINTGENKMDYSKEYKEKLVSPDEAVKCVKSGDEVDYGLCLSTPVELDAALAKRKDELSDIKIRSAIVPYPRKVMEADPNSEVFTFMDWHFTGYIRQMIKKGTQVFFIPLLYRNMPLHYRRDIHVNVAMLAVAPMDDQGYFNFSLANSASKAICESADIVILEVNKNLPRVLGVKDESIHISEVDHIVESDSPLAIQPPAGEPSEVDKKVAAYVLDEICDGACLQLGIGSMPNTIGQFIADSDLKDLGIHTEMLVDSYLEMYKAGRITNNKKQTDPGKGVFAFCMGSQELYDWTNENPGLVSGSVDYVNDPYVISQNDNMISINNCIEVDLFGQTCAEAQGTRQITGTGGQLDFLTATHMSKGGKGLICMSSSFKDKKTGEIKSRIVPQLVSGSAITDPRSQAYYIITEYGKANLAGRSTWERAEALINIAHPKVRDELIAGAEKLGIWKKTNK